MKQKALMSASMMLIASRALAASAGLSAGEVIDTQKIKEAEKDGAAVKATANDLKILAKKNIIQNDVRGSHEAISKGFGSDKKSLSSKYYGDLVERLKLAQNAAYDSTNITSTGFQTPSNPDVAVDSCHGVCHGVLATGINFLVARTSTNWSVLFKSRLAINEAEAFAYV
jgi:hypothetical protein